MEVTLHQFVGQHPNIIEFYTAGEDKVWCWIAMEYAEGGDLFDKIEADVGVHEDIAHFYFTQLMAGVAWMHAKGIGHRDIKPENILLSDKGDLKLADFGLATLFAYKGDRKESFTLCGSPPYIAPEVITRSSGRSTQGKHGYAGDQVDIWSCGVVLFVLLVGNTPWDEPTASSWEYAEYARTGGKSSSDPLWSSPPADALSLLRGMMKIDFATRFTHLEVRRHPWFTRTNPYLTPDGRSSSPVHLATKLLESLKIDMSQEPTITAHLPADTMDLDDDKNSELSAFRLAASQPEVPVNDIVSDLSLPSLAIDFPHLNSASASQPVISRTTSTSFIAHSSLLRSRAAPSDLISRAHLTCTPQQAALASLPTMSQFSQNPTLSLTLTQHARRFRDIVPSHSLTRFISHLPRASLLTLLSEALHRVGISAPPPRHLPRPPPDSRRPHASTIRIRTVDGRRCGLQGDIVVEGTGLLKEGYESKSMEDMSENDDWQSEEEKEFLEVHFVKVKGDPVEWRRIFKKIVIACKEGVYIAEE